MIKQLPLRRRTRVLIIGVCFVALIFPANSFYSKKVFLNAKRKSFHRLAEKIIEETRGISLDYAVLIKDLDYPDFKVFLGKDKKFPAASLIKLPLAVVVFKAVEDGKLSLSQKITIRRKDITGGSGKIKEMNLPLSLTLQEILEMMITKSDNTATNKVIDLLGYEYINNVFRQLALEGTVLNRKMMDFSRRKQGVENYTTVSDICRLLESIYQGKLVNEPSSIILLSILKKQEINDRLTRYLSKKVHVAHKTGLEKGIVHDAGIVLSPKGNYIICVLTHNGNSYRTAKKFIAKLSLLTYNFYR